MIIGGAVGGVVLIIILAVALSGSDSKKHADAPASKKEASKKPDVSQYEKEGITKCEAGLKAITDAYRSNDKDGLQKGVNLISEGNGLLDKANQLSGNGYDTKKYNDALYLARKKLMELR